MIENKELRIGNIFWESYGGYYKVVAIGCNNVGAFKDSVMAAHINGGANGLYECSHIEPIPLSPDILLKCGAVVKEVNHGTAYMFDVGDFDLFFGFFKTAKEWQEFKILGNGGYDDGGEMDITKTCQYLHQLQNLYFALTQTELEFKP